MRVLFTGDWQTTAQNIPLVDKVVERILEIHQAQAIDLLVHLGDIKHVYNPVDFRVALKVRNIFEMFWRRSIPVLILPGNHDHLSMHSSESWLPAFREYGEGHEPLLTVASDAMKYQANRHCSIFCLPFEADKEITKRAAYEFLHTATRSDLLIFHDDISGCKYDSSGYSEESLLKPDDIHAGQYAAAIGGHIHLPQKLGDNIYYVGSPFAHDWGEVNQWKSFLLGTYLKGDRRPWTFKRVPVGLPGVYDPLIKGFEETRPADWSGHRVRIHVPVDSGSNYQESSSAYRSQAEADYPGAEIVLVPQKLDTPATEQLLSTSDPDLIKRFVGATVSPSMTGAKRQLRSYLLHQLSRAAALNRATGKVSFVEAEARNFLPFEHLEVSYQKTGVLVISGNNQDWGEERSNGSGKTSYLQPPSVALFGRTMKGQQFDSWKRRGSTGESWVRLKLLLPDGRTCEVFRGRQPRKLQITVDGQDQSSGMGDRESQRVIENLTGLTWDTLTNGLYIDQQTTSKLVHGTDTERKAIFSQFLNLGRFATARNFVMAELAKLDNYANSTQQLLDLSRGTRDSNKTALANLPPMDVIGYRELLEQVNILLTSARLSLDKAERESIEAEVAATQAEREREKAYTEVNSARSLLDGNSRALARINSRPTNCPTCGRPIRVDDLSAEIARLEKEIKASTKKVSELTALLNVAVATYESARLKLRQAQVTLGDRKVAVVRMEGRVTGLEQELRAATEQEKIAKWYRKKIQESVAQIRLHKSALRWVEQEKAFLVYCQKAFSKDGLPSHLMGQICPALNSAAKLYSRLFSEDQIAATFRIEDSDLDVDVQNDYGGETLKDQSKGETSIATLILAFALRDVLSQCDLLILDEPGDGLDEPNARQFARGLLKVAKRFPSVFITSHNPFLLGELSGSKSIIIEKKAGVARACHHSNNSSTSIAS